MICQKKTNPSCLASFWCFQSSDPDATPTFIDLRNQPKDMETLHKVRLVINITTYDFPFL